jgi:transposase-like protein
MAGTRRVTLREASEILGVSVEAVRKRVKRASLRSDKGPDGRVYVYLDEGGDASYPGPGVESSELVDELRRQNDYLRQQLDIRTEELKEHRRLLAGLIERVPELEAPSERSEQPGAPETAEEQQYRGEPHSDAPGAQAGAQRRPWWRRVFGG